MRNRGIVTALVLSWAAWVTTAIAIVVAISISPSKSGHQAIYAVIGILIAGILFGFNSIPLTRYFRLRRWSEDLQPNRIGDLNYRRPALQLASVFITIAVIIWAVVPQPTSTGWNCMYRTACGVEYTAKGPALNRETGDFVEIRGLDSSIGDRILERTSTKYIVRRDANDFALVTVISGGVRVRHKRYTGEFDIRRNQLVVLLPNEIRPHNIKLLSKKEIQALGIPQEISEWAEAMRLKLLTENHQIQQRWEQALRRKEEDKQEPGDTPLAVALSRYQKEGNVDEIKRLKDDVMRKLLLESILDDEQR